VPFKNFETFEDSARTALAYAVLFTKKAKILVPPIEPRELLKVAILYRAISELAGIHGWLPMDVFPMEGYVSWLGKWLGEENPPSIAIKSNIFTNLLRGVYLHKHAMFVLLAIILHEVGHEVTRDPKKHPTKLFLGKDLIGPYRPESLKAEAEAWLFSFFLCGFIFAQIVSADRPDHVHEYLI